MGRWQNILGSKFFFNNSSFFPITGDMICSMCGLVVGDRVIDVGSEWRTFSNDKGIFKYSKKAGPKEGLKVRVGGRVVMWWT